MLAVVRLGLDRGGEALVSEDTGAGYLILRYHATDLSFLHKLVLLSIGQETASKYNDSDSPMLSTGYTATLSAL